MWFWHWDFFFLFFFFFENDYFVYGRCDLWTLTIAVVVECSMPLAICCHADIHWKLRCGVRICVGCLIILTTCPHGVISCGHLTTVSLPPLYRCQEQRLSNGYDLSSFCLHLGDLFLEPMPVSCAENFVRSLSSSFHSIHSLTFTDPCHYLIASEKTLHSFF